MLVDQTDARELGVHAALPGTISDELPPYVVRDADTELDRRLEAAAASPRGGLVLVVGASTAGKTRALAAALVRTMPQRLLVAPPEGTNLRPLPAWLSARAAQAPHGWVVWLDDLERHLGASGLTPTLLSQLGQADAIVAATIRQKQFQLLRPTTTDHGPQGVSYAVLKFPAVTIDRCWSPAERERAMRSEDQRLIAAAGDGRFGVAEQLAAGPVLQQAWQSGPDNGHIRGYAMVAAAVDLARVGLTAPLTREQIAQAHTAYLPGSPPLPEEAERAWEWATQVRSGVAGLLVPTDHYGHRWRAFDYLTTETPIPESTWRTALKLATNEDCYGIAITAKSEGEIGIAEAAWLPLIKAGDTLAMFFLGDLLREVGRVEEAERWWRQAAEEGDTFAMFFLGGLLVRVGRVEEAERWWRQAAEEGDTGAMSSLGGALAGAGRVEEAEGWWRQAAEEGDRAAMFDFGDWLAGVGRVEEAERWWRQAAEPDDTLTMHMLAYRLVGVGRIEEAERWYRQAAEEGDTDAMSSLGDLLTGTDRVEEAEWWWRQAAEEGDTGAMSSLGGALAGAGRVEEAEGWWRQAAEEGDRAAMFDFGDWLAGVGRVEEAERWWRQAAEPDDTLTMHMLAYRLVGVGRIEEAERWYRQAAEEGDTDAMSSLGDLLTGADRVEEAEQWYRQAHEEE
ncbi:MULTISPECIES: tetratricopeptide repeat protein [unclassified Nocardiopsis]|uniref:tetratricopeptide repeat protein n=1 Tax=unclassified Nocardiopsis TaxID=2649073 RepID=UPI001F5BDAF6|nr:tetratricopeptide repeat protein [Nocardiopsis sp. TSRI0078]